ncbi:hypothetical protein SDC9_188053 [bioreactor metagenome]|uniref:Uncharacterized protein n=1 Tax=bioreactor metagenome TaxID=1076179 RepID=A0A645HN86_9ZZZZ
MDFISGFPALKNKGYKSQSSRERSHQNGVKTIGGTVQHPLVKRLPILLHVLIPRYQQDSISRGNTKKGNKTDDGRYADNTGSKKHSQDPTNQCQRKVEQNDGRESQVLEFSVQQQEDDTNCQKRCNQ